MSTLRLSRSDREFLRHLAFREGNLGRPCWVYRLPRNRWGLVVWTMFGAWAKHPKFTKNGRTLAQLESAGLIEYGPATYLPSPYDHEYGSTVTLTGIGAELATQPTSKEVGEP